MSTDEKKLNIWIEHFECVPNHVVSSDVPPFAPSTETISPARSIKSIPSGKAAGINEILAEFYKSNHYMAAEVLQPILEEAWLSEALPEEWIDGISLVI